MDGIILMRLLTLCIMVLAAGSGSTQTRSLIIDATGTVNDIVAAGQIGNASGFNDSIDYTTGTIEITLPFLQDLDIDYSEETAWYQIGVTCEISASIFGDTDDVEVYFSFRTDPTLAGIAALEASNSWNDLWVQVYPLADGGSINDIYSVRFLADAAELHGEWVQFLWEIR